MKCTKCGSYIEDGSLFCPSCGTVFSVPQDQTQSRTTETSRRRDDYVYDRGRATIPVRIAMTVAAVVVVALFMKLLSSCSGTFGGALSTGRPLWDVPQSEPAIEQAEEPSSEYAIEYADEYILPDSSTRLYTTAELEQLSNWELFIARNEIYARHGRRFRSDILRGYFESTSWYEGTIDPDAFDESLLNETEKANAKAMLEIEKARDSEYL